MNEFDAEEAEIRIFSHAHGDHSLCEPDCGPVPLGPDLQLPDFPIDTVPDTVRKMILAVAEFTQTDPAMAGTVALGVLSACAAGRVVVEVAGGWTEPLCLYTVVSSPPGTRKSPVFAAMTSPLLSAEEKLIEKWKPSALEAKTQRKIAIERARRTELHAAKDDTPDNIAEAISAAMMVEAIEEPTQPRILADDVTSEALAELLAEHGGRIAVMSAEGGIFDTLAGRYSHGVPNLDVVLKGWSGEPVKIDRRSGPPRYIPAAHLVFSLAIQPSVLTDISRSREFRGRGLLARFLYALPPNNVGSRRVDTEPVPDDVAAAYAGLIGSLAADLDAWRKDPAKLLLNADARAERLDYERRLEPRLAPHGNLGVIAEWGSKAAGQMIRIAGLLHLAEHGSGLTEPISGPTMSAARKLVDYYSEHARSAFVAMGFDGVVADAKYVVDHLQREQVERFTVRDLHAKIGTSRFPQVTDLTAALNLLEDHNWIARLPMPERTGPGRRPSPSYITQFTKSTQTDSVNSVDPVTGSEWQPAAAEEIPPMSPPLDPDPEEISSSEE